MLGTNSRIALLSSALFALGACSGSGSSGGASSTLSVPSQMTIVAASDVDTGSFRITPDGARSGSGVARVTGGTDYDDDVSRIWVHDDSMEPLDTINMILCMLDQTGYDDATVLNTGPYRVLVNEARCESRGADPNGEGGQSTAIGYQEWTIDSTRASDSSPQIVKFWIDWDEDRGPGGQSVQARLYGKLTILSSPTTSAPYGEFTLHFKLLARSASHTSTDTLFRGTLSTVDRDDDLAEYSFYMVDGVETTPDVGEWARLVRARVVTGADGTSGKAFSSTHESFNEGSGVQSRELDYHLTFNEDYLARKTVDGSEVVEVFDRNDFTTRAWRYGVYEAESRDRVTLQSGFSVNTTDGRHGYVGYHGLWFPPDVDIETGTELVRRSYDGGSSESYTAFVAPGRLERHVRTSSTLGNLGGEVLRTWDNSAHTEIQVEWDGTDLLKTAVWSHEERSWTPVSPPTSLNDSYSPGQWLRFWSDARGDLELIWPSDGTPTDATTVSIWSRSVVNADSEELAEGNLQLWGYFQMPRSQVTQAQANYSGGQSPFFPDATSVGEGKTYVFDRNTLTLKLSGSEVLFADGVDVSTGPSAGGIHCGPMLASALGSLDQWESQATTYRWQFGPNDWNQLRTVRNASDDFVQFDPPVEFSYTHDEPSNTRFHGRTFRLEYFGNGDLHGIPHFEDTDSNRWYPGFTIPSGTGLENSTGSYLVKILEAEQTMRAVADPEQVIAEEGLDIDTTLDPPTSTWQDPAIGSKPTVTTPPLFIDGVRQTSAEEI